MAKPASAEQKAATADQRRIEQAREREKAARVKANLAGLWSREVTRYYLLSFVVVLPAIFLGRYVNRRLHNYAFLKFVHAGLILIGTTLLVQAVRG